MIEKKSKKKTIKRKGKPRVVTKYFKDKKNPGVGKNISYFSNEVFLSVTF